MHPDYKLVSIKKELLDVTVEPYSERHQSVQVTNSAVVRHALNYWLNHGEEDDDA